MLLPIVHPPRPAEPGEVRALIIHADPEMPVEVRNVIPSGATIRAILNGFFERIGPSAAPGGVSGWHAYINEMGKAHRLVTNLPATILAVNAGWDNHGNVLCGPAVFLGDELTSAERTRDNTDEGSVPAALLARGLALNVWAESE